MQAFSTRTRSAATAENAAKAFGGGKTRVGKRSALGDISNAAKAKQANKAAAKKSAVASVAVAEDMALDESTHVQESVVQQPTLAVSASAVSNVPAYEDIDQYDDDDAQCCVEYINEIFAYLRVKERAEAVSPTYMSHQADLTPRMRAVLLDWMVDVHLKFKLLSETMFLSVNIVDRYLMQNQVMRHELQLVGITAMLIASKYEEIFSPEVRDFVYICDKAYSKDEILSLEIRMLSVLNFSLTPATPLHFLRRFSKAARSDSTTHTLSKYLIELTLPEYDLLRFLPSTIAAAAVYVSRAMRHLTPYWNATLEHYTQHSVADLRECAEAINEALIKVNGVSRLKATKRKFSAPKLLAVARTPTISPLPF